MVLWWVVGTGAPETVTVMVFASTMKAALEWKVPDGYSTRWNGGSVKVGSVAFVVVARRGVIGTDKTAEKFQP